MESKTPGGETLILGPVDTIGEVQTIVKVWLKKPIPGDLAQAFVDKLKHLRAGDSTPPRTEIEVTRLLNIFRKDNNNHPELRTTQMTIDSFQEMQTFLDKLYAMNRLKTKLDEDTAYDFYNEISNTNKRFINQRRDRITRGDVDSPLELKIFLQVLQTKGLLLGDIDTPLEDQLFVQKLVNLGLLTPSISHAKKRAMLDEDMDDDLEAIAALREAAKNKSRKRHKKRKLQDEEDDYIFERNKNKNKPTPQ